MVRGYYILCNLESKRKETSRIHNSLLDTIHLSGYNMDNGEKVIFDKQENGVFRVLKEEEIPCLLDHLRKWLPTSAQVINVVTLKAQKKFKLEELLMAIYIYEDAEEACNFSDPFLLIIHENVHSPHAALIRTPAETITHKMILAFEKRIDWTKIHCFPCAPKRFAEEHLISLCKRHGWKGDFHQSEANFMPQKLALTYEEIPYHLNSLNLQNVEVRQLSEPDAAKMLENYKWALPHSPRVLQHFIKHLVSCGVYVNNELASYAVLTSLGLVQVLATEPEFRRKGYGLQVLKAISRKIADLGLFPVADLMSWNEASRNLQINAGYQYVEDTYWIVLNKAI